MSGLRAEVASFEEANHGSAFSTGSSVSSTGVAAAPRIVPLLLPAFDFDLYVKPDCFGPLVFKILWLLKDDLRLYSEVSRGGLDSSQLLALLDNPFASRSTKEKRETRAPKRWSRFSSCQVGAENSCAARCPLMLLCRRSLFTVNPTQPTAPGTPYRQTKALGSPTHTRLFVRILATDKADSLRSQRQ